MTQSNNRRYDYTLLTALSLLVVMGLVILYSTSAYNGEVKFHDSFYYLKGAVRGEIKVKPFDLASLENNMLVVEILDAAIKSAKNGKPVKF